MRVLLCIANGAFDSVGFCHLDLYIKLTPVLYHKLND